MSPDNSTEAGVVAELTRATQSVTIAETQDGKLAMLPNGTRVNLAPEVLMDTPKRKRASVALHETYSFIEYLNAHKLTDQTHVFGECGRSGSSFTAIIDFHTIAGDADVGEAGWGEHKASLTLKLSEEFSRWLENDRKPMSQEAFAEFLDENMKDVIRPDAGALVDTVQMLIGKKSVNFKSGRSLRTGAIQLEYVEEISGMNRDGGMEFPSQFVLGICPVVGAEGIEIPVKLRFRISPKGELTFIYVLERPVKIIEAAFNLARNAITEKTGLTVHLGSASVTAPPAVF